MKVKLTYYKSTGKYYTHDEFEVKQQNINSGLKQSMDIMDAICEHYKSGSKTNIEKLDKLTDHCGLITTLLKNKNVIIEITYEESNPNYTGPTTYQRLIPLCTGCL